MKFLRYIATLFLIFSKVAFATSLPPKQVTLPFTNEPLQGENYVGLSFNYDLTVKGRTKISCRTSDVYDLLYSSTSVDKPIQFNLDDSGAFSFLAPETPDLPNFPQSFRINALSGNIVIINPDSRLDATASCDYNNESR